jgi:ABC-type multidrug transport system fused ATPase/permease subunit
MFYVSWKLSLVAFVSVPVIVVMSKVYGEVSAHSRDAGPCTPRRRRERHH